MKLVIYAAGPSPEGKWVAAAYDDETEEHLWSSEGASSLAQVLREIAEAATASAPESSPPARRLLETTPVLSMERGSAVSEPGTAVRIATDYFNALPLEQRRQLAPLFEEYMRMGAEEARREIGKAGRATDEWTRGELVDHPIFEGEGSIPKANVRAVIASTSNQTKRGESKA